MKRILAVGAMWDEALTERLAHAVPDWKIRSGAATQPELVKHADVLVPFGMKVERTILAESRLQLVQQFGVGLDNVDLDAAREFGIAVCNTPSAISGMAASVAEGAVHLVLSCARLPSYRAGNLAEGRWNWTPPLNLGLAGRTAGIVGLGSIGKQIARRLAAFDLTLVAVTRSGKSDEAHQLGLEWVGGMERIDELVSFSDFIIICVPLTAETRDLFGAALFGMAKPGASIINVGRGAIIQEGALISALEEGHLHAAGLDTVRTEPPQRGSMLLTHPRIVLTPHDAGVTDRAFDGVAEIIANNLARLRNRRPLLHRVA